MLRQLLLIGAYAAMATAFSPASRLPAALYRGGVGGPLSLRPGGAPRFRVGAIGVRCQAGGPPLDKEPLDLCEENVLQALEEAKETLGTIFGNSVENTSIGITGDCTVVDIDGPFVTVRLSGRFWHKRADVLARVDNYLKMRVPELIEVNIEDPRQLDDELPENQK